MCVQHSSLLTPLFLFAAVSIGELTLSIIITFV